MIIKNVLYNQAILFAKLVVNFLLIKQTFKNSERFIEDKVKKLSQLLFNFDLWPIISIVVKLILILRLKSPKLKLYSLI